MKPLVAALASAALLVNATTASAQTLTLTGLDSRAVSVGASEWRAIAHQKVVAEEHGKTGAYSGVPLGVLLARVAGSPPA